MRGLKTLWFRFLLDKRPQRDLAKLICRKDKYNQIDEAMIT